MRLAVVSSVALLVHLIASPSSRLAGQTTSSPIRKVADVDSVPIWGIAEPTNGRFIVFGSTRGIKVFDRRSRSVTPIIDSSIAVTPTWFGGSLSLSASGQRLVFFGSDDTKRKNFVWSVDLDTMTGKPLNAPHRVSLMPTMEASISDDGRSIALVTADRRKLLVIPSGGGDERVLDSAQRIQTPRWTPNGKTIYYIRARGNGPALARISASGGQPDSLAAAATVIGVSPDGQRVAYYPPSVSDPVALIVADLQGKRIGRAKVLDNDLFRGWSRFQPATLLGSRDFEPKTLETISLENAKITPYPVDDSFAMFPRFSPNGRQLAVVSTVDDRWQIVLIDAANKQRRVLRTDAEPDNGSLQWSPDGAHIAFLAFDTSLTRHDLYVVDVATSRATRLADVGPARWDNRVLFRWRSDGRSIDYVTGTNPHAGLPIMRPYGGGGIPTLERVTLGGEHSVIRKLPLVPPGLAADGGYRLLDDSLIALAPVPRQAGPGARRDYFNIPKDSQFLNVIDGRTGAARTSVNRLAFWNTRYNRNIVSPDGKWLVFGSGGEKDGRIIEQWGLTSLDGKTVRLLGEPTMCDAWPEQWLPDSRAFLAAGVASCDNYHIEHFIVPIDGAPVRHLAVPNDYGMAITPDGHGLLVAAFGPSSTSLIALDVNKAIAGTTPQAGNARKPGKN